MPADTRDLYERRIPLLEALRAELERGLLEVLKGTPHVDRVDLRVKEVGSFINKATRYENPLEDIEDQIAGRVLVFFTTDVDVISQRTRERWSAVEAVQKEPERDAEFGYESRHHIFVIPEHAKPSGWSDHPRMPTTFELQIRTLFMHAYAEPQHDLVYKSGDDLPREIRRQLGWIAASAWGADRAFLEVMRATGEVPNDS